MTASSRPSVDAVAVTSGPGLTGALLVGVAAAKAYALALGVPLYGVNHLAAHVAVDELEHGRLAEPTVAMLVSGGHSSLLLVPDVAGGGRRHLLRVLDRRQAVVGPPRAWEDVRASYDRAVRTVALVAAVPDTADPVDSEDHLVDLVVSADPEALADLRVRVLAPLAELGEATRERLAETLLCWLLHQGRRDEVAAALHVHAQTVRYRMQQVRALYGDRLMDERFVRELVVALPPSQ